MNGQYNAPFNAAFNGGASITPFSALLGEAGQSLLSGRKPMSGAVAAGISAAEVARVSATLPAVTLIATEYQHDGPPPTLIYSNTGSALQLRTGAGSTPGDYSLEMSLGHDLNELRANSWAIANYSMGGSTPADWDPAGTYPAPGNGNLAHLMVNYMLAAELTTGKRWRLFNWIHGESAALDATFAANYQTFLDSLFTFIWSVRSDMKIALLRLSTQNTMPFAAQVRAAQDAIAALYPTKISVYRHDTVVLDQPASQGHPVESITMGNNAYPHVANLCGVRLPLVPAFEFEAKNLTSNFFDVSVDPNPINPGIVSWSWTFGDGGTSTAQHPSHTYAANGAYTVQLVVTAATGATAQTSQTITVANPTGRWHVDATSGESFPLSVTEMNNFLSDHLITAMGVQATVANLSAHGWTFQDASGNPVDFLATGGAKALSTAGFTAASYHQVVTGYADFFIGPTGLAVSQSCANATFLNINANNRIAIWFAKHNQAAASRDIGESGSGSGVNSVQALGGTDRVQARTGANIKSGNADHVDGVPHWYVKTLSVTDSEDSLMTDLENIVNTYAATSGTRFTAFTGSTDATASIQHRYGLVFDGVRMTTAEKKHLIQAFGRRCRFQ